MVMEDGRERTARQVLDEIMNRWFDSGNKSAGARARKALLEMTKTGKELRKKIQDIKNNSK